jgi:ribose transport system permease protein
VSVLLTDLRYRVPGRYRASWAALLTLVLVALIAVPTVLNGNSVKVTSALAGVLAVATLGQMLVVMLGAIDLSVPAVVALSAGWVVHFGTPEANMPVVIAGALLAGAAIGLLNGLCISVLRLNAIIVTLAMYGLVSGGIVMWTGVSFSLSGEAPKALQAITQRSLVNINACFLAAVLIAIVVAFVLTHTAGGRQVAAIGSNRRAARLQGVRVHLIELSTFFCVGLLYGIAGVLIAGFVGTPNATVGAPYQLATITAVAIAGVTFNGGPANVISVVVACVFLQLLDQALAIYGFAAGWRVVAQGVALVVAVAAINLGQYSTSMWHQISGWRGGRSQAPQGTESPTPAVHLKEKR